MTIDMLKAYGANADEGLNRCMNNEDFYFKLIKIAVNDAAFETLGKALSDGDLTKAFEESHKLKGAIGNLALTPVYDPLVALTELLRHKEPGDYDSLYRQIIEKRDELNKLIETA